MELLAIGGRSLRKEAVLTFEQRSEIEANRQKNLQSLRHHKVVSQSEWTKARLALLEEEKRMMKQQDALAAKKRALPWVKVEKKYVFGTRDKKLVKAAEQLGKRFLAVMMGANQDWQCQGCSSEADHVKQLLPHFEHHDMNGDVDVTVDPKKLSTEMLANAS